MNTSEDIIQRLSGLTERDREWILRRLSPTARATLLSDHANGSNPVTEAAAGAGNRDTPQMNKIAAAPTDIGLTGEPERKLANTDPRAIAAVLMGEPAWITHAVIQRDWPWRSEVMCELAATTRNDADRLEASGMKYSRKLTEFLLVRLAGSVNETAPADERSAFDKLVSTLGSRLARKRLRLRA